MSDPAHLFVYGSLRRGETDHFAAGERARLYHRARWVGTARVPGQLLDLGDYPGLVETDDPKAAVVGDLLALRAPRQAIFQWLDPFEGIRPGGMPGQYTREVRPVERLTGETEWAWVYVLKKLPRTPRFVESGDWLTR